MKTLTSNKAFWLLLVICVVTILPFLGLPEYHTKGEPRESIVSYSMLESDNWILPRNNGGEIPYKPPFFHWTIAAVSTLNGGQVTEMTSRLPSAIALISMTLSGFLFCSFVREDDSLILWLPALPSPLFLWKKKHYISYSGPWKQLPGRLLPSLPRQKKLLSF